MREAATTALLALYSVPENVSPLHAFTARFSTRFAELVYDVSEAVAVKGVRASLFLVCQAPLLPRFPQMSGFACICRAESLHRARSLWQN